MSLENDVPTAVETVDRKELLAEQFNEVERETAAAPQPAPAPAADRPRDEAGKFAPKDKAAPVQAAPQPELLLVAPATNPNPWDTAPNTWKKDKHPLWQGMSPEARQYAYEQEEKRRVGVEALAPKAELADKINKAAEPYINTIRGLGIDLPQAVSGLMKVDHDLRTLPYDQKLQVLQRVALGYGIDLSGQVQAAQPTQAYNPAFQNIQNELTQMKGQFQSFTQQQEAAQKQQAMQEIERFTKQAEHFSEVEDTMTQLLQSGIVAGTGMTERLQDAYDKAIRLHPEIFDKVQSAKQASADAEKRKAADEAAKRAKASAVSVRGSTPSAKVTTDKADRRSMLREALDGLSERL